MKRKTGIGVAVLFLGLLVAASAAAAAGPSSDLSYSGDNQAPDPYIAEDALTKAVHDLGEWGTSHSAALKYEADDGSVKTLPATVNTSEDNPYDVVATNFENSLFGAFPRDGDNTSALDASEWTSSGANSSKFSVTDTETADGVDAVQIQTDGSMATGDIARAEYSNFSITSDEDKRYLQIGADIATLDADTRATVRIYDADDDYKQLEINGSADASSTEVLAAATGDGQVSQVQLQDLQLLNDSDSDGFDDLERVAVNVSDGDLDLSVAWLDLERKSATVLGQQKKDTDDDDALETVDITEPSGTYSIYSLATIGSELSSGKVHDITYPVTYRAQDIEDSDDYNVTVEPADKYRNYDHIMGFRYRVLIPSAIDLRHSGLEFQQDTEWPETRYTLVEMKEGAADSAFSDLTWGSDLTSSFDAIDKQVSMDSTISAGTSYAVHEDLLVSSGEHDAITSPGTGSGGGGQFGREGGLLQEPIAWISGALAAIGALLLGRRRGG